MLKKCYPVRLRCAFTSDLGWGQGVLGGEGYRRRFIFYLNSPGCTGSYPVKPLLCVQRLYSPIDLAITHKQHGL